MANKKKNPAPEPTPEQQARAASSSRKKQRKTYVSKTVKIVLVVIGVLAMLLSVSAMACSGLMSQAEDASGYKLTGGVAATINGTNLTEDTVTKQIMSMRTSYGYTKDKDWAQYLVDNDLTPKKYRKQLIDSYTQQILLQQAQKENGVTVSDEEVEKAWKDACKSAGGAKAFKKTRTHSRRVWRSRNSRMPSRPRASPRTARLSITSTKTCPATTTPAARRTS